MILSWRKGKPARNQFIFIIILLIGLLIFPSFCYAEENKTILLEITLPSEVMLGLSYDTLLKIINLNYSRNYDSHVNVTVFYNLTKDDILFYASSFSKIVNSFSTAGNGYLFFNEMGTYLLCAKSPNSESICKNITVINPMQVNCFVNLTLFIPKIIFSNNEQVEISNQITFSISEEPPYIIEYWVEDLFGEIIKKKINTSNDNDKVFTPKIEDKTGIFVAKNKLIYTGCNNVNQNTENAVLFVVKNQDYVEPTVLSKSASIKTPKTNASKSSNSTSKTAASTSGKITSFYTRTKNYNQSINLYANIKSYDGGYLFLSGNGLDQTIKLDGLEASQKFTFNVKAKHGENIFYLELFEKGNSVDKKSVVFTLKDPLPKLAKAVNISSKVFIKNDTQTTMNNVEESKINQKTVNSAKNLDSKKAELQLSKTNEITVNSLKSEDQNYANSPSGLVVYETNASQAKKYSSIAVAAIFGVVALGSIFGRKKSTA